MTIQTLSGNTKIAVVGLGYVGLPLAHAIAQKYTAVGYDINSARIAEINSGKDGNLALTEEELSQNENIVYTDDTELLADCSIYIITAPTPVDKQNQPDLSPVKNATATVAAHIGPGDVVIFESTVYPGATEEECIPILEKISGLTVNQDFYVGYSPERVNPGDGAHSLIDITKVTSGSCPEAADLVDDLYNSVIRAGTHKASSLKVAEAAKVIENTQRDLNIALVNELAILFDRLGIDTREVLDAAGSKWNFLKFTPGLVGGHCIGVDPYYLTYKAQQVGYHPDVILAGRRINDSMGEHVVDRVVKLMMEKRIHVIDSRILILGLAFKENCPDTRNTRVTDIVEGLQDYHAKIDIYDPWVAKTDSELLVSEPKADTYDAIILAVGHKQFVEMGAEKIRSFGKSPSVLFDVKSLFPRDQVDGRL